MSIGAIWDVIILSPMINVLIVLSHFLFNSFGLGIIVLTLVIRAAMYPLTVKQLKASKAMQTLQPKIAELQKKYARDKQKLAQEQMRLYRESGMTPTGCLVPMLLQVPIWIALYQAIVRVSAVTPEDFLNLSRHLYSSWTLVFSQVPLETRFLWLDLSQPDRWMVMPILVGVTMWVQQKMVTPPSTDPKQQAQSQLMVWMMPLMFAFLTLSFPSGLALYWVVSNIVSIIMQYFITGWGGLVSSADSKKVITTKKIAGRATSPETTSKSTAAAPAIVSPGEEVGHGQRGDKREERRGSDRNRPGTAGRKPRRGGDNRPQGR